MVVFYYHNGISARIFCYTSECCEVSVPHGGSRLLLMLSAGRQRRLLGGIVRFVRNLAVLTL